MQNGFPYLDILIFGVIAIFLIFRLKNILGTKTGFEDNNLSEKNKSKQYSNVVSLKSSKINSDNIEIDIETKNTKIYMFQNDKKVNIRSK